MTHIALGHVDWTIAGQFALGAVPAAALGGRLAGRFEDTHLQRALAWLLIAFGIGFTTYRLTR